MNDFFYELQGWMGPNYSISTACATSNYCILNAANHIIRGEAVRVFYFDVFALSEINTISHAISTFSLSSFFCLTSSVV
jgi:3-oxoacyl-(acyl-carrier-protein) synthase